VSAEPVRAALVPSTADSPFAGSVGILAGDTPWFSSQSARRQGCQRSQGSHNENCWRFRGRVCLGAALVLDALHAMCRSTLFPWFLVRLIPALLLAGGLHPSSSSAEDPVESVMIESHAAGDEPDLRGEVIEELRQLGRKAGASADGLLAFITDLDAPLDFRVRAVRALRDVGLPDADRARLLYGVLADPGADIELRQTILLSFADQHEFAAVLVPALLEVLNEPTHGLALRRQVMFNLSSHLAVDGVVEQLTRIVRDVNEPVEFRNAALDLLRPTATQPPDTLQTLRAVAVDPAEPDGLRLAAVDTLGRVGTTDAVAADLVEILFQPDAPIELQRAVARMLTAHDQPVPVETGRWHWLLNAGDRPVEARRLAAWSLARSSDLDAGSIELGIQLLGDPEEDMSVRLAAAEQLRAHGAAEPVIEAVEWILRDEEQPIELREAVGGLWVQVARGWLGAPEELSWEGMNSRLAAVDRVGALLEPVAVESVRARQSLAELRQIRAVLAAQQAARWGDRARDWMRRHPWTTWSTAVAVAVAFVAFGLAATWFGLSRRTPMRVWDLNRRLSRWDWQVPAWLGAGRIGPRQVLLLARWAGSIRVLDAWMEAVRPYARQSFEQLRAVHGVTPHVSLPVRWNGRPCPQPPWDSIRQRLTVSGGGILVGGAAGTGKTGCALECARRLLDETELETEQRMSLPVWIGRPQTARDGAIELAVEVRSALALLVPAGLLPDRGAILNLLKRGDLLPLLDGVSEWPAEVIPSLRTELERLRGHHGAFLLTTRMPDAWAGEAVTRLELSPLGGGAAIGFLQAYLTEHFSEGQVAGGRIVAASQHWAALTDEQPMPVQIIRIFGDVAMRQPDVWPTSLVEVGRDYLCWLHRDVGQDSLDESLVVRVACRLAWAELSQPDGVEGLTVGERQAAVAGVEQATEIADYLERRLGLLERWQPGDRVRFRHRPLAGLLAALHLIEENRDSDTAWQQFLQQPHPITGSTFPFVLQALWEAGSLSTDSPVASLLPEWVRTELARRLGIDPARHEARCQAMRARALVREIVKPENPERTSALEELAAMGSAAVVALPMLESVVRDQDQDLDVRFGALTALGLLGAAAFPARGTIEATVRDRGEQLFIRLKALEFLAAMGRDHAVTVSILVDRLVDPAEAELLRLRAGNILAALPGNHEVVRSALTSLDVSGFPPAVGELVRKLGAAGAVSRSKEP
jgi:hypothetical protein